MRRWLGWIALAGVVCVGLLRLRFEAEPLALLPPELPAVEGLRLHQKHFSAGRELWITVDAGSADAALARARAIGEAIRSRPGMAAAVRWELPKGEGLAENVAWMWMQRPPLDWAALEERLGPESVKAALAGARERLATSLDPTEIARAGYDPFSLLGFSEGAGPISDEGIFASPSGTFRVIQVEPARPGMNYREAAAWLAEVKSVVAGAGPGAAAYTGGPAFLAEVAAGMESDLRNSVAMTLLAIGVLFWLAHRSFKPLLLLVAALGITLLVTIGVGGMLLGSLNVISCGFAAVMMGLVVDFGLVGYQEIRAHPGIPLAETRRQVLPGIAWSAVTTAGTFLSLRLAGLPGLGELGTLTAIGLCVGALVMVGWFLPRAARGAGRATGSGAVSASSGPGPSRDGKGRGQGAWLGVSGALIAACVAVLGWRGLPGTEGGAEPLRPRQSPAYEAMAEVQRQLGRTNSMTWLLFMGSTPDAVAERMEKAEGVLSVLEQEKGLLESHRLPLEFWPRPANAATNAEIAGRLAGRSAALREAVIEGGFQPESFALSSQVLEWWGRWSRDGGGVPLWPTNSGAAWMASMVSARTPDGGWIGLGTAEGVPADEKLRGLGSLAVVTGWDRLGPELLDRVRGRVGWLTAGIGLVLTACLWMAFRRWTEVVLGLGALALSFTVLLSGMSLLGSEWNLLNLVAVPLVLGTSVDSTIHVQLAMRRHGGRLREVWRSTGVALVLCAGANVAGFGSLAWSSNAGLASLDVVCAGGVLCVLAVSLGLLPRWWLAWHGQSASPTPGVLADPPRPSRLYAALGWRVACLLGRVVPRGLLVLVARAVARGYAVVRPARFAVVCSNLLPVANGDVDRARRWAWANFDAFAAKLVDLWRLESGVPGAGEVEPAGGWDAFHAAVAAGRGVILVTPHLGNWELGGPLLVRLGIRPLVLTAPEPGSGLTEARARARAMQGIDTLVVGADPFAFVEVIRRLQSGGVVALLVDRPPAGGTAEVSLFGRTLNASTAAAELARATGSVILPVTVVWESGRYRAYADEPVAYDRATLGSRDARRELTARILREFEGRIRQFPEQWFHFVPVWREVE